MLNYWVSNTDSVWSSPSNWSSGVPQAGDVVIFNGGGTGSCSIDATVIVDGFQMLTGYPGRVSQFGYPITIGSDASFMAGAFDGTRANIVINGSVKFGGSDFTSTDQTLQVSGDSSMVSGLFSHNRGLVSLVNSDRTFTGFWNTFYDLQFKGDSSYTRVEGSSYVEHKLILSSGYLRLGTDSLIHVRGDLSCGSSFGQHGVDNQVPLFVDGSGVQHLILEAGSLLPSLYIDKTTSNFVTAHGAGPIAIDGNLEVWDGTFSTKGLDIHVGNV